MAVAGFVSEKCFSSILIKAIAFVFSEHGWAASSQEKTKKNKEKKTQVLRVKPFVLMAAETMIFGDT